jgi:hypothetical protein
VRKVVLARLDSLHLWRARRLPGVDVASGCHRSGALLGVLAGGVLLLALAGFFAAGARYQ